MSPDQNKLIVREFFDSVWNKRDDSVVDRYLALQFIEHFPGMEGGRAGFKKTTQLFRAAFPDINLTIEDEIATEEKVIHRWTWRCTLRHTTHRKQNRVHGNDNRTHVERSDHGALGKPR